MKPFVCTTHLGSRGYYQLGPKRNTTSEVWNYFSQIHNVKDSSKLPDDLKDCDTKHLAFCNYCGWVVKCVTGGRKTNKTV